jgi:hypothetical protein
MNRLLPKIASVVIASTISISLFAIQAIAAKGDTPHFAPGQEWSIKSASPTTAKVIIGRVERWEGKVSVSVSIVNIPIPQGMPGGGGVTEIADAPFEETALSASVDRLLATGVSPSSNFATGYDQWKNANGGIYTVTVEKAIEIMFQTVRRRMNNQ